MINSAPLTDPLQIDRRVQLLTSFTIDQQIHCGSTVLDFFVFFFYFSLFIFLFFYSPLCFVLHIISFSLGCLL